MKAPQLRRAITAAPRLHAGRLFTAFAVLVLMTACAQPRGPEAAGGRNSPANATVAEAQLQERQGSTAFAHADLQGAYNHYRRAAQIYQSLALTDPMARAQLSQVRVLAEAGQLPLAQREINAILDNAAALSPATLTAAHGRAANLALQATPADASAAGQHLQAAEKLCAAQCVEASALHAMRGRLHLAQGEAQAALDAGQRAQQAAGHDADRANAMRLMANGHQVLGAPRQALALAEAALALDQASGAADRVALDLDLIAQAHQAQGNTLLAVRAQALADQSRTARRALQSGTAIR